MDVTRTVKEEKPGASKRMIGLSRNVENSNIVVPGLKFGDCLDVLDGYAIVFEGTGWVGGVAGWLRFGWQEVDMD